MKKLLKVFLFFASINVGLSRFVERRRQLMVPYKQEWSDAIKVFYIKQVTNLSHLSVKATTSESIAIGWQPITEPLKDCTGLPVYLVEIYKYNQIPSSTVLPDNVHSHIFEHLEAETAYKINLYYLCLTDFVWQVSYLVGRVDAVALDRAHSIPMHLTKRSASCDQSLVRNFYLSPSHSQWPFHLRIEATTSDSITIGWQPAIEILEDCIIGYEIHINPRPSYYLPAELPSYVHSYVWKNLNANTTYGFSLDVHTTSLTTQFFGLNSHAYAVTLDRDVKFIPTIVAIGRTNSSITIRWLAPPPELRDHVHQYKVVAMGGSLQQDPVYLPVKENSYVFNKLWFGKIYKVKVAACSDYVTQCGTWSSEHRVSTLDQWGIPGIDWTIKLISLKVAYYIPKSAFSVDLRVVATTSDSIWIRWTKSRYMTEEFLWEFRVMAIHLDAIQGPFHLDTNKDSYVFQNLTPDTSYRLLVAYCVVDIDCQDWNSEREGRTIDRDPKFIPSVSIEATTAESITIRWSGPPPELQHRVHQYKVTATQQNETKRPIYLSNTTNDHIFENLKSESIYRLEVAACSDLKTQCANWSSEIGAWTIDRDPQFVPNVSIEATTSDSITIRWSRPPPDLLDRVHQYKVMLTHQTEGSRGHRFLNKTVNSYVFDNLTTGTSYYASVAACSDYATQCSDWSLKKEGFTIDTDDKVQLVSLLSFIVTVVLLLTAIVWLIIRKRRETASRRKFIEETLRRFNTGALDCLDPELNMSEQAELLPYKKKWEYPRELLKFDKILGSGAFGIVKKAQAKSISRNEGVTTVAVKMVRATHTLSHMTALSRELKILAYLGKHVNVVNLLGACTKHVSYGELLVIVEFCRYGNLRDHLIRNRDDFIDEFETATTNIADSASSAEEDAASDSGTVTSARSKSSSAVDISTDSSHSADASVAVEDRASGTDLAECDLRSKYLGDYADLSLEPIRTRDLVCWAWQLSRGMKYLGKRRILHGDLAARNVLLADRNVVKICDFGLAKTLYTEENYKETSHSPLPVKWMAIESLKERTFSVKSDIWSYGIVLWELFSLAETPYPGIGNRMISRKLAEGYRMARPKYATEDIYGMMSRCWDESPSERPSFEKLEDSLVVLLDDGIKTDYMELSAEYARMNADDLTSGERGYLTISLEEDETDTIEDSTTAP